MTLVSLGKAKEEPQDDALATYAGKIDRASARVDWARPAADISRLIRAYESCRDLPPSVLAFASLAVALRVPFEWMFAPVVLTELKTTIEARRTVLSARRAAVERDRDATK